jgi:hypothetical protein
VKAENFEDLDKNVEACATRSPIQTAKKLTPRAHMQKGEVPEATRSNTNKGGHELG